MILSAKTSSSVKTWWTAQWTCESIIGKGLTEETPSTRRWRTVSANSKRELWLGRVTNYSWRMKSLSKKKSSTLRKSNRTDCGTVMQFNSSCTSADANRSSKTTSSRMSSNETPSMQRPPQSLKKWLMTLNWWRRVWSGIQLKQLCRIGCSFENLMTSC